MRQCPRSSSFGSLCSGGDSFVPPPARHSDFPPMNFHSDGHPQWKRDKFMRRGICTRRVPRHHLSHYLPLVAADTTSGLICLPPLSLCWNGRGRNISCLDPLNEWQTFRYPLCCIEGVFMSLGAPPPLSSSIRVATQSVVNGVTYSE